MRIYGFSALLCTLMVAGCNTTPTSNASLKVSINGKPIKVDSYYSIYPDCSSLGAASPRIINPPRHGTVEFRAGTDFPNFKPESDRAHCNMKRVPATLVLYTPSAGYIGPDSFQIDVVFASGYPRIVNYNVEAR